MAFSDEQLEKARHLRANMLTKLDSIITTTLTEENYDSVLNVIARFPQFDYRNDLFIWLQNRDAKYIASLEACKELGLDTAGSPIKLLTLDINVKEPEYLTNDEGEILVDDETGQPVSDKELEISSEWLPSVFYPVNGTDADEFNGEEKLPHMIQKFRRHTGYSYYEGESSTDMPSTPYYIIENTPKFALEVHPESSEEDRIRGIIHTTIVCYFDERMDDKDFKDKYDNSDVTNAREDSLRIFAECAVGKHFGIAPKGRAHMAALSKIKKILENPDIDGVIFMHDFLNELVCMTKLVISAVTDDFLSFNQVYIAKRFFFDTNYINIYMVLSLYKHQTTDAITLNELIGIIQYVMYMKTNCLTELVEKIKDHKLFIYPTAYCYFSEIPISDMNTEENNEGKKKVVKNGGQEHDRGEQGIGQEQ